MRSVFKSQCFPGELQRSLRACTSSVNSRRFVHFTFLKKIGGFGARSLPLSLSFLPFLSLSHSHMPPLAARPTHLHVQQVEGDAFMTWCARGWDGKTETGRPLHNSLGNLPCSPPAPTPSSGVTPLPSSLPFFYFDAAL